MNEYSDIPTSLADVAEVCGNRAALALLAHFEGLDLYFPHNPTPDHPIIKALGEKDGQAVCHHLAGETVTIPLRSAQKRKARIRELHHAGYSTARIAREMKMTQRWVRMVVRTLPDARQGGLFGEE